MIILGIETSCDETAAAVLTGKTNKIEVLSNVIASSSLLQSKFGGIIPEQAAREQLKSIIPVIKEALDQAEVIPEKVDAIAVTYGPGLIGSLLVGVETAKTLSWIWNKPLIPVNHLLGHFYANWIGNSPKFPCIGLLVSGGHTDLVLFKNHSEYEYLGGTRDDAAGECFDKCARLMDLPYPGGPEISKNAQAGNPKAFKLPRPMINSKNFDFSFSGLKTAVSSLVEDKSLILNQKTDLCASIEQAIIDPLIKKTLLAAKKGRVKTVILGGGVSANKKLISEFKETIRNEKLNLDLFVPAAELCTDNAAMIAARAFFEKKTVDSEKLQANPSLGL